MSLLVDGSVDMDRYSRSSIQSAFRCIDKEVSHSNLNAGDVINISDETITKVNRVFNINKLGQLENLKQLIVEVQTRLATGTVKYFLTKQSYCFTLVYLVFTLKHPSQGFYF